MLKFEIIQEKSKDHLYRSFPFVIVLKEEGMGSRSLNVFESSASAEKYLRHMQRALEDFFGDKSRVGKAKNKK